jgi:hypothetical protein
MKKATQTRIPMEVVKEKKLEIEILSTKIMLLEQKMLEANKNILTLSKSAQQLALMQQQIATQIVHMNEAIKIIQDAVNPQASLKYDMSNEPYN